MSTFRLLKFGSLSRLKHVAAVGPAAAKGTPKKKPAVPPPPKVCERVDFFVAEKFGGWQEVCLGILADKFVDGDFPAVNEILDAVKASPLAEDANFKNVMKMVMPFVKFKMNEAKMAGADALGVLLVHCVSFE